MLGNFGMLFSCTKKSFGKIIRVSNSLDPEQARGFFWPDLRGGEGHFFLTKSIDIFLFLYENLMVLVTH